MIDKGCDNCYYEYFDEKAYPCSLCIRGIERTDKWQPRKKYKSNAKQCVQHVESVEADTPQTDCERK